MRWRKLLLYRTSNVWLFVLIWGNVIKDFDMKGATLLVLRSVDVDTDTQFDISLNTSFYFNVHIDDLKRIQIQLSIRNADLLTLDLLYCSLHFRRKCFRKKIINLKENNE